MTEQIAGHDVIHRPLEHGAPSQTPRRIIVHAMAYELDTDEGERLYAASFLDRIGLSAHLLIAPDGTPIRCRDDEQGAWHARGFNTDSLGIEVLVPGVYSYGPFLEAIKDPWVTQPAYITAVGAIRHWCRRWSIGTEPGELDRHCDVDRDRKEDPGQGFPWNEFLERVRREP